MITNSKLVFNLEGKHTVDSVLTEITKKLVEQGFATSEKSVLDGFKAREKQSTTGLAEGFAIPHVSSSDIKEAKIVVVKLKDAVDWKALDGKPTDFVIAIAVPADGRNDHFDLLTQISGKLADPEFVKKFKASSAKDIVDTLNNMKAEKPKAKASGKGKIKVVGVTTCVTGVAHTFMAAQALEDEGAKRGWDVKIERQGQMTKNKLTAKDIQEADYVIFGISKQIDGKERFNGKKTYTVEVAEPITKAAKVMDELVEKATVQSGGAGSSTTTATGGAETKASFMSHLMAGISFMIPYIAMAGIVLGLTTAFGYRVFDAANPNYAGATGFQPVSPFANALNTLAGGGFSLYIPILAMMIANSIAGRKAMAPAAILAFVLNIAPSGVASSDSITILNVLQNNGVTIPDFSGLDQIAQDVINNILGTVVTTVDHTATNAEGFAPFFNYSTLGFWGWTSSPALGFLGGIVSGYMVGFGVHYFTVQTDKVNSAPFQAIVPLLIIPILFTVVPWFIMAFVGYIPLYAISVGLNALVKLLIDHNLFFIAGALMGAMICFDLGGPVNKMAMTIGVIMLSQATADPTAADAGQLAAVNGVCAVAVSIPPTVLFFSNVSYRWTPLKMDEQDVTAAWTASLMGFFGITEGSIPFAAKDSKKWMPAFITAGIVGGAIMGIFIQVGWGVVDNVPMWGGPIIWAAGGYSWASAAGATWQQTNWLLTMVPYFFSLTAAGIAGCATATGLEFVYSRKNK